MEGYILKITFCTDGDFGCSHKDMKFDGDYGYSLFKIWEENTREQAVLEAISLLKEIKETLRGRDYVVEYVNEMFDKSIKGLIEGGSCCQCICGNQDGTVIDFGYGEFHNKDSNIVLSVTQEEYETLVNSFDWVKEKIVDINGIDY